MPRSNWHCLEHLFLGRVSHCIDPIRQRAKANVFPRLHMMLKHKTETTDLWWRTERADCLRTYGAYPQHQNWSLLLLPFITISHHHAHFGRPGSTDATTKKTQRRSSLHTLCSHHKQKQQQQERVSSFLLVVLVVVFTWCWMNTEQKRLPKPNVNKVRVGLSSVILEHYHMGAVRWLLVQLHTSHRSLVTPATLRPPRL